jgi:DNA helicase-2/ATP-dependent DNA helicase PcrA
MINLSEEQQGALNIREGYWACYAGPGSGKTRVLTARHKALCNSGVNLQKILSLTFTKKAAEEMRNRLDIKSDTEKASGLRTAHSLALAFALQERKQFPFTLAAKPLAPEGVANKILSKIVDQYPGIRFNECKRFIGLQKQYNIRPENTLAIDIRRLTLKNIYKEYQHDLKSKGLLDFDDLIAEMVNLLKENPEILDRWSYQFVQCDEAQDCNGLDWDLLELLSKKYGNLFAVGDPNQCIFEFRGANPYLFDNFGKMFPTGKSLYLGANYRSSPAIVDFIKSIAPQKNELIKKLYSETTQGRPLGYGPDPTINKYNNEQEEAEGVIEHYESQGCPANTAILCRTNLSIRPFEDRLEARSLKYHLLSHSGFFEQPEIKHVLTYAKDIKTLDKLVEKSIKYYQDVEIPKPDNDPIANLRKLVQIASEFDFFSLFLNYVRQITRGYKKQTGLSLGTIHASKGLEFERVYLTGINEGNIPHKKSDNIDEESRILFVGCSRPSRELHLSYVGEPSRFLTQVMKDTQLVLYAKAN